MNAATLPIQRPATAKLLTIDSQGTMKHWQRSRLPSILHAGDLVIANDAATLPASLQGRHVRTHSRIEVRLAGRSSLQEVRQFSAIVFGPGDFRTRTEDRRLPPLLSPGDWLQFGTLHATIDRMLDHPRFLKLRFEGARDAIWEGIARHGRPIQYSHLSRPLNIWDTWTPIAGPPVAFEPPSAGFVIDWNMLGEFARKGIAFTTITHAAGISSTGDAELDALLPLDEPYRISSAAAKKIEQTRARGGRIVAVGTTVVRALEHAADTIGCVHEGEGVATQKLGAGTDIRVVDAVLSGTHEPGTSHYELLRAFTGDAVLQRANLELEAGQYRTHEFGDSVFLERARPLRCKIGSA